MPGNQAWRVAEERSATDDGSGAHLDDGGRGNRNSLGCLIFGDRDSRNRENGSTPSTSRTRAATAGKILPPLPRAADSLVHTAYKIWNLNPALREAKTVHAAKEAAKSIASSVPL